MNDFTYNWQLINAIMCGTLKKQVIKSDRYILEVMILCYPDLNCILKKNINKLFLPTPSSREEKRAQTQYFIFYHLILLSEQVI